MTRTPPFQPPLLRARVLNAAEEGVVLAQKEVFRAGATPADLGEYAVVFALRVLVDAPELGTAVRPLSVLLFDLETAEGWR